MKQFKKLLICLMVAVMMVSSVGFISINATAEADAPVNIALNKDAYASANEANLERLGPKGAFDGNLTDMTNGRWSSGNITLSPQWIYVDLGAEMRFDTIRIYWQAAYATKYELQYSNDLEEEWKTIISVDSGQAGWREHTFDTVTARYVRLYATESNGMGSNKPISIIEMEIYQINDTTGVEEGYVNLAQNTTITVENGDNSENASYIVDGNEETIWETSIGSSIPTLTVDLGEDKAIEKIVLKWTNNYAFKYKLYLANNKATPTYSLALFHEEGMGGDESWELPINTKARYIKIELIEAKEGSSSIGLKEIEVLKEVDANEPVNIALNKDAYASANEANLERLGPKGAFDGNLTDMTNGRWSSGNITQSPQWIYVDLGAEMRFDTIRIYWQAAYATKYELQYSNDLEKEWQTIVTVDDGQGSWEKHTFYAVTARYVRLYATESNGLGNAKPISIMEMEIYNTNSALGIISKEFKLETITSEMTGMPTYTYDNGNIVAEIFCSDTDFVVEDNGTIHTPLVDKEVLVTYLLTDKTTGKTEQVMNIPVTIPGKYSVDANDNAAPATVPSIQEWKGAEGTFKLTSESRIVVSDTDLQKAAEITKADISDLFGLDLTIVNSSPKEGDIVLTKENADQTIGDQGYTLDIDGYVTVSGTTYQGVFFGTRSVLQALESSGNLTVPKGTARDYAKYEHRKFMLDVARKYIPMWYLKDLVKYAAWYKFTDIQIHLNDSAVNSYSSFRLESDVEGLTATDGYYTKDEYREFQYYAKDYGITIISEFDTPAHSRAFIEARPDLALVENGVASTGYLDIRSDSAVKDDVYKFIADLYEEYMGGDNPVIVTEYFNVGLDEYPATYKEDLTRYTKYVMELVHDTYNKTPMAWASLGCTDSVQTKLPDYPIMDAWGNYAIPFESLFNQGYQLINATNKYGYIVPGGNNGYPDFAEEENMYNELSAGRFRDSRKAVYDVAEGHPQIAGGSVSLWNDRGIYNGISVYDIFARTQSILPIYAQTFWYGKDSALTYEEFKENVNQVGIGANISADKGIESESDRVYDFDMENSSTENDKLIIRDTTNNHYDAVAVNATIETTDEGKALKLNGDGYLQMQHTALKWPYTIIFDLKIDDSQSGDIILFEEIMPEEECNKTIDTNYQTRRIYLKEINGSYKLMYDRENYHFEHNVVLEKGQAYQLVLISDEKYTNVYVNGILQSTISGPVFTISNTFSDSASMYLPLQKVGVNLVGTLDNIKVYNRILESEELGAFGDDTIEVIRENVALNKEASASTYYDKNGTVQPPEHAFDGDTSSNTSRWASGLPRTHDEWLQVDLKDIYLVDDIIIYWQAAYGVDYQVLGSLDGNEWFEIINVTDGTKGTKKFTGLGDVETRYVKILGTKAYNNAVWGYSIFEVEVFESPKNELLRTIEQNKANLSALSVGKYHGQIGEAAYQEYAAWLEQAENTVLTASTLTEAELLEYKAAILQKYTALKKQIVTIDKARLETAIAAAEQKIAEGYNEQTCTEYSWSVFVEAKEKAAKILADYYVTQDEVDSAIATLSAATEALAYNGAVIYENITVIETTVNMTSATDDGAVIFLQKGSATLDLLRVDSTTYELTVPNADGSFVKLCDNKGVVLKASADTDTFVAVVYNDITGTVRYYVGQPNMSNPYYQSGENFVIADGIASGSEFKSEFGTEKINLREDITRRTNIYNIKDSGTAEIIAFQEHDINNAIRLLAGLDMPWHGAVGFEVELFENGIGNGIVDKNSTIIYDRVVANDKYVYAIQLGYKYLAACAIENVVVKEGTNYYMIAKPYTLVGETKYYGEAVKINIDSNGNYTFDDTYNN